MKKLLLALLLCNSLSLLYAQPGMISGRVITVTGTPLSKVSIVIKETRQGTETDLEGSFRLAPAAGAKTLEISYVGYLRQTVVIGDRTEFNITLAEDPKSLSEVVVTALGITRDRRSLGYATQKIGAEQIADKGEVNLVNALQGKVAGVNITNASGSAGASTNINIRGISSFIGNNQPLFVIDGVPTSNEVDRTNAGNNGTLADYQPSNRAIDIDINNIESVNVLKGPAASVLYGSRAAAGAIIITTKKGSSKRGKAEIAFTSSYSQQTATGLAEMQNSYGQGLGGVFNPVSANSWGPKFGTTPTIYNGLLTAAGAPATPEYKAFPNNIKDFYETGKTFDNNLSINGGDVNQNFNFAIGNVNQTGILPNTSFNRTNVKFGANTVIRDRLKLGGNVTFTNSLHNGILGGNGATALGPLVGIPRSFNLPSYKNNYKDANGKNFWPLSATADNPYFSAYENTIESNLYRFNGFVNIGYDILSWLNVSYRLGADAYTDRRKQVFAISSNQRPKGVVLEDIFFRSEVNGDLLINAKKSNLFVEKLNVNLLLGQNINQRRYQNVSLQGDELSIPDFYNTNNAAVFSNGSGEESTLKRLLGYYSQLSLAYDNYLFLELTGRIDQSSTLPKANNTYFYPSINAGFVFTDAFKINNDVLSYGKVRASIAKVGNDADPYLLESVFVSTTYGNNVSSISFPFNGVNGFRASTRIGTDQLTPEFTTSYEVGLNLGLFKNRASIDLAYFDQRSEDQIINVAIPFSTGYGTKTTNIGEMTNKGIEAVVNITAINNRNFKWDITGNFTRIRNKVLSIAEGVTSFQIPGNAFTGTIASIVVDQPYGVIVGNKTPRAPDGQFIINPATGLFATTIAGQVIADPNPDYTLGVNNTFRFHAITLSFLADFTKGGDFVSFTVGQMRSLGTLKETAVDRELPRIIPGVIPITGTDKFEQNTIQIPAQTYWRAFGLQSDLNVYDATVFRIRELTVGYDLPATVVDRLKLSNIRFSLFGRNLFYVAPNSPIDPAVNTQGAGNIRGLEIQSAPNTRSLGVNLRVGF